MGVSGEEGFGASGRREQSTSTAHHQNVEVALVPRDRARVTRDSPLFLFYAAL